MASNPHDESGRRDLGVAEATDGDAADWEAALESLPGTSYYHRFAWRAINRNALGQQPYYLLARERGRVVGLLPLTLVASRLFGRILCSLPFVNFGGPCAEDGGTEAALLQSAKELAMRLDADRLELRCWQAVDCGIEASLQKVSMVVPLTRDPGELLAAFTHKHRKNVRRALKNGLQVESGGRKLLPEFYSVLERAWRDLGTPFYRREYFEQILEALPESTRIFVCRQDGKAIAVALNGEARGRVEGLWNGGLPEGRELQANYVLYWEMLKDACTRGYTTFNLGRSTAGSPAEDFKRRWNAERHQLHWYAWSPTGRRMPELNIENPRFRLAIAAWQRMPLALARVVGPPLARCIP